MASIKIKVGNSSLSYRTKSKFITKKVRETLMLQVFEMEKSRVKVEIKAHKLINT